MLKSITVENYRGFREKTTLELRPLTILLGRNSSGKSSLTRLIPLLQQSLERQSSSPILWSSEAVDLGNISDVIAHSAASSQLKIGFRVSAPHFHAFLSRARYDFIQDLDTSNAEFEYFVRLSADGLKTRFDGIEIHFAGQALSVDWNESGEVVSFKINEKIFPLEGAIYFAETKSLFPQIGKVLAKEEIERTNRAPVFYDPIRRALKDVIHGRTSAEKIDLFARHFTFIPRGQARESLKRFPNVVQKKITEQNSQNISDLSMINDLPQILRYLSFSVSPIFLSSAYIGPLRASGKRFDRIQELSVNRLDSSGDNTAMYIYSLDLDERRSFNELLVRACGHTLAVEESGAGHVSLKIGRQGQTNFENIADVGFGFSQLVPVVAQLHAVRERSLRSDVFTTNHAIFAVEQPELHLHPAMQANLADLFVGAIGNKNDQIRETTMIVETHSETFVAQVGLLIAEKVLSEKDVAVYFVNKDEATGISSVQKMSYNEDGIIGDWPVGFFSAL